MYNDLYRHKKSDSVKWIIAFGLIVVLLLGMVSNFILDYAASEPETEEEGNGDAVPSENREEKAIGTSFIPTEIHEVSGIKLMSAPIAVSDTVDGIPTAQADTGIKVTSTLVSSTGTEYYDKRCDWTIAFKNASSSWASGKKVTDFVTMTVSEDMQSVAVACVAPFGEPIVIKAVSRENTSVSATCQLDYVKRIQSAAEGVINKGTTYEDNAKFGANTVSFTYTLGLGTVEPTVKVKQVKLNGDRNLADLIQTYTIDSTERWAFYVNGSGSATGGSGTASFNITADVFNTGSGTSAALNNALYYNLYNVSLGAKRQSDGKACMEFNATPILEVTYNGTSYQTFTATAVPDPQVRLVSDGLTLVNSVTEAALDVKSYAF